MKKWKEFLDININLDPNSLKKELESIPGIKILNQLYDSITNEIHLDFKFEGFRFSLHNPYGGGYGYWFFYKIRRNKPEITKKLEKLLKNHFQEN